MHQLDEKYRLPDLSSADDIESILIIRFKALGDIVLTLPIIRALRQRFPHARMVYVVFDRFREALNGDTGLDEVVAFPQRFLSRLSFFKEIRRRRFDLVLDLISSPVSAYITYFSGAKYRIGMDVGRQGWCYTSLLPRVLMSEGKRLKIYTFDSNIEIVKSLNLRYDFRHRAASNDSDASRDRADARSGSTRFGEDFYSIGFPAATTEERWASEYIGSLRSGDGPLIGVVAAAKYQAKSWPVEKFIKLCNSLVEGLGARITLIWGPGERDTVESLNRGVPESVMIPEVGIAKLGAIVSRLDLLVGVDSGPKHIAVLQGVPTVTLFGPTDPRIWDPMNDIHRAVYLDLPCSPCGKKKCGKNRCMTEIKVSTVVEIASNLIGARSGNKIAGREE